MITASNVKDYLKGSIDGVNNWFSGSLRSNKEKGICIYSKQAMGRNKVCLGGLDNTSTFVQGYSILIHWNKNANESEQKASNSSKSREDIFSCIHLYSTS